MKELSLHILDLLQNAVEAGASRIELVIEERLANDWLVIAVRDNGKGMDEALVAKALDPFVTTRTTRKVGLGLPLLTMNARRCNGDLSIHSRPGAGTTVTATFQHSHIDRPPLGNIKQTLLAFIIGNPAIDLHYRHTAGDREFAFSSAEVADALGDVPLTHPDVLAWLDGFLSEGLENMYGGADK